MTLAKLIDIVGDFLFARNYGEVRDGGHCLVIEFHLGTESVFIRENEILSLVKVHFGLAFNGHGFKDIFHVIVLEEFLNLLIDKTVHFHHQDVFTVHFVDDTHGGVALAEAGDGNSLTLFLQRFIHVFSIICFLDFDNQFLHLTRNIFMLNIH